MTELYINDQLAVLPDSMSFTQVFENPYFTKSSNYSLDIELPLRGCDENISIFGHINRLDVTKQKLIFPARLLVDARTYIVGSAVLLNVSDLSVKIQLVSGNAEFNFLINDEVYVDELDLGEIPYPPYSLVLEYMPASNLKKYYGSVDECEAIWLPVLYNGNKLYNDLVWDFGTDKFNPRPFYGGCCIQPYLTVVIKRVVEHFGYTIDRNYIDDSFYRHFYVANAVQTNKVAHALPHWTVSELFDEIEKFCGVIIVVNERDKTIDFLDVNSYYVEHSYEFIDDVLDESNTEIDDQSNPKDVSTGNVGYDIKQLQDDKYCKLDKGLLKAAKKTTFNSYSELVSYWNSLNNTDKKYQLMIANNRYYINYLQNDQNSLKEVNLYADLIRDEGNTVVDVKLRITPAKIIQYNVGLYMSVADYVFGAKMHPLILNVPSVSFHSDFSKDQKIDVQSVIENDQEIEADAKRKDVLELAINTGVLNPVVVTYKNQSHTYNYAFPFTDYMQKVPNQQNNLMEVSLSLNDVCKDSVGRRIHEINTIHSNVMYVIKFINKRRVPDVKRVFIIGNKKYVCVKIEVVISGRGLEPIQKGYFYRIS